MKLHYESELYHFGIKGMRWGIRRFQNKDGTLTEAGRERLRQQLNSAKSKEAKVIYDRWIQKKYEDVGDALQRTPDGAHTIVKGATLRRVATEDDKIDGRVKYVSMLPADSERYRRFKNTLGAGPNAEMYEFSYSAKKDLKVASKQQVMDYVMKEFGDTPIRDVIAWQGVTGEFATPEAKKAIRTIYNGEFGKRPVRELYDDMKLVDDNLNFLRGYQKRNSGVFGYTEAVRLIEKNFTSGTMYQKGKSTEKGQQILKHYKDLGYDAIIDIEDSGFAQYPLILVNPDQAIAQTGKTKL